MKTTEARKRKRAAAVAWTDLLEALMGHSCVWEAATATLQPEPPRTEQN